MKLLLVEDDREIQEMLGDYLRTEAYEVVCASNGRDACRLFDEGGIGLVLLDLMIPQVSGMDVMEHIRKKSVVPIIILSAGTRRRTRPWGWVWGQMTISQSHSP